jgi:4,4'-diaponeurosporenoate glycosyltransferase
VFLDADVRCPADGLAPAVALQRERGGLVSVWPYHLRERTYERLNALFAVLSVAGSGAGSLFPPRRPSTALGPVLVTTKEEYRRAGGHESVRADVIEDIALGRRYAGAGLPVTLVGGGDAIAFRMYPDGLIDLVRGWSKSFGRGTALISPLRVVGIAFWVTCAIGSLTWAGGLPRLPSVVLGLLFALQMAVQFRRVGRFDLLDALLYPIHAVFFVGVWVWALFKALVLRRVLWRGRSISVERTPD